MSFVKLLSYQSAKKGNFVTLFLKLTSSLGEKEKKARCFLSPLYENLALFKKKKKSRTDGLLQFGVLRTLKLRSTAGACE